MGHHHHHRHPDHQASIDEFMQSDAGAQALSAVQDQGISPEDATPMLAEAAAEAHAHAEEAAENQGLLGANPGKSFFAAFASGLVKGDGIIGSLEDGAGGVVTGRVAQAVADHLGVDPAIASTVAAAATPFLIGFLKNKLGGS